MKLFILCKRIWSDQRRRIVPRRRASTKRKNKIAQNSLRFQDWETRVYILGKRVRCTCFIIIVTMLTCALVVAEDAPSIGPAPTVDVECIQSGSEDGPTPAVFKLSRSGALGKALDVEYVLTGTATPGDDYIRPDGKVTFSVGASEAFVIIHTIDDDEVEPNERLGMWLAERGYRVPADSRWIDPPALPHELKERLEGIAPALRARMAPLAYGGPWKLRDIVQYRNHEGRPVTSIRLPPQLLDGLALFFDRQCEVVLDFQDVRGFWTLRRSHSSVGPIYGLTLYRPDDESHPFHIIRMSIGPTHSDFCARVVADSPEKIAFAEFAVGLGESQYFTFDHHFPPGERRRGDIEESLSAWFKRLRPPIRDSLQDALKATGAYISDVDAYRAFPEITPSPDSVSALRSKIARLASPDAEERDQVSAQLIELSGEELLALVRLRSYGTLAPEQIVRIDKALNSHGWVRRIRPAEVEDHEQFLADCLAHPDKRVASAAQQRLEANTYRAHPH